MNTKNKTIMIKEKHAGKHLKQAKKALNSLDFEKARIEFERAFKMNPKYEIIYQHFATLLDTEDGVRVYTKAIEINPEDTELLLEYAKSLAKYNKDEEAISAYSKVLSLGAIGYITGFTLSEVLSSSIWLL